MVHRRSLLTTPCFFPCRFSCVTSAMNLLYIFAFNFVYILRKFSFIFTFALANYLSCALAPEVSLFSKFAQRTTVDSLSILLCPSVRLIHKMALLEIILSYSGLVIPGIGQLSEFSSPLFYHFFKFSVIVVKRHHS